MTSVAVSGCGAAARLYHQPALLRLERQGLIRVVGSYDPHLEASQAFCGRFATATPATSYQALLDRSPDLLIIASPPDHHAEQVVTALRSGVSVLCEKPLAPSLADAEAIVTEAKTVGGFVSVGMIRRQLGAAQLIASLLSGKVIGQLEQVSVFEGGPFDWPVHSPDYFSAAAGGVGVLEDIGTHVLDLLTWWLGEPEEIHYADDALGGIAANCRIELTMGGCPVTVRLSRDWYRPNTYEFSGSGGWIRWADLDPQVLELGLPGSGLGARISPHDLSPTAGELAGPVPSFTDAFADQLIATIDAMQGHGADIVTAEQAVATVRLINRCRAGRQPMSMPWLSR